jgi:two-component system sensor histidine kinase RegB
MRDYLPVGPELCYFPSMVRVRFGAGRTQKCLGAETVQENGSDQMNPGAGHPSNIAFSWLLLLRWGAVACQALLILAVYLIFDVKVPLFVVAFILLFQIGSNLYFFYLKRRRTIHDGLFNTVMFLDVSLLTVLLYYAGGPMNPFTFLFLVHIVLGAILMRPRWSWGLTGFTVLCYAVLFYPDWGGGAGAAADLGGQPIPLCHGTETVEQVSQNHLKIHLQGMWFAFAITAFFIVFFVGRIQGALEDHQRLVSRLREEKVRNEKLASLATLAAGAAHEFSTPLSTIAVAAGEMMHSLKNEQRPSPLLEDVTLIRQQVDICKEIIFQMAADAGEHMGEAVEEFSLRQLLAEVLATFAAEVPDAEVICNNRVGDMQIRVPYRTFSRTLKGLLRNAGDASPAAAQITITCRCDSFFLYFEVEDKGEGMDPETLAKASEPFFTTKETGKGLGLGLYLTKSFARRFGGDLQMFSEPGRGSRVIVRLALKHIAPTAG